MKMQARKDGYGRAVDDVKQAVREPAQDGAPHVTFDPLVKHGVQER